MTYMAGSFRPCEHDAVSLYRNSDRPRKHVQHEILVASVVTSPHRAEPEGNRRGTPAPPCRRRQSTDRRDFRRVAVRLLLALRRGVSSLRGTHLPCYAAHQRGVMELRRAWFVS